jgi:hypothetical protein
MPGSTARIAASKQARAPSRRLRWTAHDAAGKGGRMATSESDARAALEGLLGTWRRVVTEPHAFIAGLPEAGGLGEPLTFLAAVAAVNALGVAIVGGGVAGLLAAFVLLIVGDVLLAALAVIVAQNLFDGRGGFEPTFRVLAYAAAPLVVAWIPILGGLAVVYAAYIAVRGLERVQRVDTTRAVLTVLIGVAVLWILRVIRTDL